MDFELRKKEALSKIDKSRKDSWDEKIIPLLNKINSKENYFTTSSCSGRALIYFNNSKKHECKWFYYSHDLLEPENVWNQIQSALKFMQDNQLEETVFFNFKGAILHFASKTIDSAFDLINIGRECGLKKGGIFARQKIISELIAPETIEIPLIINQKIIVNAEFIKIACEQINQMMQNTWNRIKKFEEKLS